MRVSRVLTPSKTVVKKLRSVFRKIPQKGEEKMTIKEIATELGLSASTVSKALNNASDISVETRNRVNNYARSIGFSLHRNQESKRICVLFENMDSHSNSQVGYPVLTGFQQAANAYRYEVVIEHCSDKNPPNLKKLCQENNFCGLMILPTIA